MKQYGLIGKKLGHSFSQKYFTEKFEAEGIEGCEYSLFELGHIEEVKDLLQKPNLAGLNVTIPYKQEVIPYLDELDETAQAVGAVNVIKPLGHNKWKGFNSDCLGFRDSLLPWLPNSYPKALVLGTGGASKAVCYVLEEAGIDYKVVSRNPEEGQLSYAELTKTHAEEYKLWINTTPLGMFPKVEAKPDLPYEALGEENYLYDLVYNPDITAFMHEGADRGAKVQNGLPMLHGQAEAAWAIWNG